MTAPIIEQFARQRVAVLGDAMLDIYLQGQPGRFCQEAPVPLLKLAARRHAPGGAANTAMNLRALGAHVDFLSVLGDDDEADLLRTELRKQRVGCEHLLTQPGRRTQAKHRLYADQQMLLRFDQGSTDAIDAEADERLLDRLSSLFASWDAVLVSDYCYGILTPRVIRALGDLQARWSKVLMIDSRRLGDFREVRPTAVKPNHAEAVALLGGKALDVFPERADAIGHYRDEILDLTGAHMAAVTLDSDGAVLLERGRPPYRSYAAVPRRGCVAGAGDTFAAAFTLSLASGASTYAACELASAAAAVVVGKETTAACSALELRDFVAAGGKLFSDRERLAECVEFYRRQGKRIVFTNGCFDILHGGHIAYLHRARLLGDVLIVGVNDDASIQRLKGPTRPINSLEDRLQVLAALTCIDHLVPFGEDTPCNLVRVIRPNIFVKGGDYTPDRLPEAPLVESLGGVVRILPFLAERSTTSIIERIQSQTPTLNPAQISPGVTP